MTGTTAGAGKLNCWEFMHCGREDECPVFEQKAGRKCWQVHFTFCNKETRNKSVADKMAVCRECAFYRYVKANMKCI